MPLPVSDYEGTALSPDTRAPVAEFVRARLRGASDAPSIETLPAAWASRSDPVYVGLRVAGELVHTRWEDAADQRQALANALAALAEAVPEETLAKVRDVEILVTHDWTPVDLGKKKERNTFLANMYRGLRGYDIEVGGERDRWTPYDVISKNLMMTEVIDEWCEARSIPRGRFDSSAQVKFFEAEQCVVPLTDESVATPMYRCAPLITVDRVTRASVHDLQEKMGNYLFDHVDEDGALTYMELPAVGHDPENRNNAIRQLMATIAMIRTARFRDNSLKLYDIAHRNLRHNLRTMYRASGSLGLIEMDKIIKLGSVALACLAIIEHPKRAEFASAERKLTNTIHHLWERGGGDGWMFTMLQPLHRDHGTNFYSGEALLTWSFLLAESRDAKLMDRFMKSFRRYRSWHLQEANRNPAFIPWHTQAYYNVWKVTEDPEMRDFIFTMNDWLLGMQQWVDHLFPDAAGQFFDPKRPKFGSPHSSSTGVYMEGLADAWTVAKAVGDTRRQETYRLALVRGLRNVMQMTYLSEVECFLSVDPAKVMGGTRTNLWNTNVRCDNVQHNLMAILKILERFEDADFEHP